MRISDWSSDVCSSDLIDGPANYLGSLYRAVPIAITVEGANILTRCLIIFGQGAIRAHPYLMREVAALGDSDETRGAQAFRSEEHTSELQSLMRISYAVFCLKKKNT